MDPHFREYLAALAGMQETYGFNEIAGIEQSDAAPGLEAEPPAVESGAACVATT